MSGLLDNLPSRGLLKGSGSLICQAPLTYICDHNTEPPSNQVIKSSGEQILFTCLLRDKKKDKKKATARKASDKTTKEPGSRKRDASGQAKPANAKRAAIANPGTKLTPQQLRAKSNSELSELCKSLGLPYSGNKETLVERISKHQSS